MVLVAWKFGAIQYQTVALRYMWLYIKVIIIIGKFIMLHVRLLNFIFGKLYHVQSIAAYRATVRDVITQYKSLLHGKLSRYKCVPYLSHNSPRITECVQCMPQINVLTLCVFISQYRVNVTNQKLPEAM